MLSARANLAASYWQAGHTTKAIGLLEQVAADSERILGPGHPHALTFHANLAACYQQIGRTNEAITLQKRVAADRERILGPDHPHTVAAVKALRVWVRERKQQGRRL